MIAPPPPCRATSYSGEDRGVINNDRKVKTKIKIYRQTR